MAVFKCKMCGGALKIKEGTTVIECECCGTNQTLPKLDDERRANLYDRANHFRRNNEFDKAMSIYETILNEDNTDAEAYWSLILCNYGIEYVEDQKTNKRIPTVNRAQFTSIYDDVNYKLAIKYADASQKLIYEAEAKTINEIQKGILSISQKEEPFDIFICYKETDSNGRRTLDSVLAQELYFQLKQEGFKVFFSRITLEDKLGSAYEPYIFAALNSAKIMVVVGTKQEYFNAVWVKNEWSRFLSLTKQGHKKVLIPAYRDMDPYNLPDEFSHLQAQDMSKLGFMQDLVRGIKKLIQPNTPKQTVVKETQVINNVNGANNSNNVTPLLIRTLLFLEDNDWDSAHEYCERILDQDPKNATAYLYRLMADLHVSNQESLKDLSAPFDNNSNYKRVISFGDESLKSKLIEYNEFINLRIIQEKNESIYTKANELYNTATTSNEYINAAKLFAMIKDYKDSSLLHDQCYVVAEEIEKNNIYNQAKNAMIYNDILNLEAALKLFKSIPGWKDSDECLIQCDKKLEQAKEAAALAEKEALREKARIEMENKIKAKERAKKRKTAAIVIICCFLFISTVSILGIIFGPSVINRVNIYNERRTAEKLVEQGEYDSAIEIYESLGDYKESENKIKEVKYFKANKLMENEEYFQAIKIYSELGTQYKDVNTKLDIALSNQFKNISNGESIFFGKYEQDNNVNNGEEFIEWIVLEVSEGKAILISKYCFIQRPFNDGKGDWSNSKLRTWLNNSFYSTAFTEEDKQLIIKSSVETTNPNGDDTLSSSTEDLVYILSFEEVRHFFSSKKAKIGYQNKEFEEKGIGSNWWLRNPSLSYPYTSYITENGNIYTTIGAENHTILGVRPVIVVEIE